MVGLNFIGVGIVNLKNKIMKDEIGKRMKEFYENRTRIYLPRRTYCIMRVDGRSFHQYCKSLVRPFDMGLIDDMNDTAKYLCENIQGAEIGFVQSDEISILLTDFATHQTDAWFDGNIQKIVSVAASMATAKFNQLRTLRFIMDKYEKGVETITNKWFESYLDNRLAEFDARTFTIPSKSEVMNYYLGGDQPAVVLSKTVLIGGIWNQSEMNYTCSAINFEDFYVVKNMEVNEALKYLNIN